MGGAILGLWSLGFRVDRAGTLALVWLGKNCPLMSKGGGSKQKATNVQQIEGAMPRPGVSTQGSMPLCLVDKLCPFR